MFFAAGAAVLVSWWQWQTARDQLAFAVNSAADSSSDTQAALKVSDRLATAAENQARLAQRALKVSEGQLKISDTSLKQQARGQVLITSDLPQNFALGQTPTSGISVQNVGPTTVKDVAIVASIGLYPKGTLVGITVRQNFIAGTATTNLSPQGRSGVSVPFNGTFSQEILNALAADTHRLFVFGKVKYIDSVGRPHIQHVCSAFFGPVDKVRGEACPIPPDK